MNRDVQHAGWVVALAGSMAFAGRTAAQAFHEMVGYPTTEFAHEVKQTSDGGYVTVGTIYSAASGFSDFHVVRFDPGGTPMWDVRYGSPNANEEAYSVEQTSDGGFLVVGNTDVFGGLVDIAALRLDAAGGLVWAWTYEGDPWYADQVGAAYGAQNVQLLPDGSAMIVGRKTDNGVQGGQILRIDANGLVIFNRAYFTGGTPAPRNVTFAQVHFIGSSSGVGIAGTIDNSLPGGPADRDVLAIRTNGNGVIGAARSFATFDANSGSAVNQLAFGLDHSTNGDFLIVSQADSDSFYQGMEFLRVDLALNPVSVRHQYIFSGSMTPGSAAIKEDVHDGTIAIGGTKYYGDGGQTAWMTGVDPNGDTLWATFYGGNVAATNGQSVVAPKTATSAHEYVLAGGAYSPFVGLGQSDHYLLRTTQYGQTGCLEECFRPEILVPTVAKADVQFTVRIYQGFETFPGAWKRTLPGVDVLCAGKLCPADVNSDGILDLGDFFDFFNFFDITDPGADINNDCTVDLADFFLFLGLFDTSCE